MVLPFSRIDFLQNLAAYNSAIWPIQVVAAALGIIAISLLFWRSSWADRTIAAVLSVFWSGMAIGYHWMFFTAINSAAYLFGGLFLLAALLFLVEGPIRGRMRFSLSHGVRGWFTIAMVAYSFVVYPLLGLLVTHPYPETPLFGVAPCPTTIFTLGFFILLQHPKPLLLAAIPLLWCLIGGSAAFLLNVPQDWGLMVAALLWVAALFVRPVSTEGAESTGCVPAGQRMVPGRREP